MCCTTKFYRNVEFKHNNNNNNNVGVGSLNFKHPKSASFTLTIHFMYAISFTLGGLYKVKIKQEKKTIVLKFWLQIIHPSVSTPIRPKNISNPRGRARLAHGSPLKNYLKVAGKRHLNKLYIVIKYTGHDAAQCLSRFSVKIQR